MMGVKSLNPEHLGRGGEWLRVVRSSLGANPVGMTAQR